MTGIPVPFPPPKVWFILRKDVADLMPDQDAHAVAAGTDMIHMRDYAGNAWLYDEWIDDDKGRRTKVIARVADLGVIKAVAAELRTKNVPFDDIQLYIKGTTKFVGIVIFPTYEKALPAILQKGS